MAALRDPLTLDNARAEWVAQQLLESGEKGILLPVNVVLDAYIRGKSRQAPTPASTLLVYVCAAAILYQPLCHVMQALWTHAGTSNPLSLRSACLRWLALCQLERAHSHKL